MATKYWTSRGRTANEVYRVLNPGDQTHPAGLTEGTLLVQQDGDHDGYNPCCEHNRGAGSDARAARLSEA